MKCRPVRRSRQWRLARCIECESRQRVNVSGAYVQCCATGKLVRREPSIRLLSGQRCRCGSKLRSYRLRDVGCHRCGGRLKALTAHHWTRPGSRIPTAQRV